MTDASLDTEDNRHPYCVVCGREYPLNEHHTRYSPERTITVCESCHDKIHNKKLYMDHLRPPDKPRMDNQVSWKDYKYGSEKFAPDRFSKENGEKTMASPDTEVVQCDVCDYAMKPKNDQATGHICRTCLKEMQEGDRIDQ